MRFVPRITDVLKAIERNEPMTEVHTKICAAIDYMVPRVKTAAERRALKLMQSATWEARRQEHSMVQAFVAKAHRELTPDEERSQS